MKKHNKIFDLIVITILYFYGCIFCLTGCGKNISIKVENGRTYFPDLQVEKEEIDIIDFSFAKQKNNICLDKENSQKLLKNINNIKIAYYKTFEKYKLAIENYNELKKIAYEE